MQQIIGREKELTQLRRCVESNRSEFVIVYGRRRVGKTFLVDSFFDGKYDFAYVGGHRLTKAKQLRPLPRHGGTFQTKWTRMKRVLRLIS